MAAILNIIIRLSGVISDSMLFRLQLLMLNCLTSIPGPKKEDKMRPIILRALLKPDSDRKSTRLNSSHLGISYAVFCLKKMIVWLGLGHFRLPVRLPYSAFRQARGD